MNAPIIALAVVKAVMQQVQAQNPQPVPEPVIPLIINGKVYLTDLLYLPDDYQEHWPETVYTPTVYAQLPHTDLVL